MKPFQDIRSGYELLDEENSGNLPGIAFSQGKFWREQRCFALRSLKALGALNRFSENTITLEVEKFCNELTKFKGEPFNIHGKVNVSILNSLWYLLVGEALELDNPKLLRIVSLLDRYARNKDVNGALASMFPYPEMMRWPCIYRLLDIDFPTVKNHWQNMKLFVEEYVTNHKSSFDENNIRDFIDSYLDEIQKHDSEPDSSFHQERGHYMLINVLIDLFFAGLETTSSSITWTLLLLLHHPEVKRKMLNEIDEVMLMLYL